MRTRKVEIEIPEDMEVKLVRKYDGTGCSDALVVELIKTKPRRWIFEEIRGRQSVVAGEYWMNTSSEVIKASDTYPLGEGNIVLRKIEE